MNEIKRAISDLSDIRSQLAASTRFRGYAPEVVSTLAIVSLFVVLAQLAWPDVLAANDIEIALVWGGVLLVNSLTVAVEAIARARRQHGGMAGAMLRGAMLTVLPITFTGLVLGAAILTYAPIAARLLPGVWQMSVGVVAVSSHSILPRTIVWPGVWYLLCGAAMAILAGKTGHCSPLMAGGPFVIGLLWIARILKSEGIQTK